MALGALLLGVAIATAVAGVIAYTSGGSQPDVQIVETGTPTNNIPGGIDSSTIMIVVVVVGVILLLLFLKKRNG